MKTFHIITFGCQMNEHDSERMAAVLSARGLAPAPSVAEADFVVLNTCSIRQKAEQKFFSELGRLGRDKRGRPGMKIAVAGCIAQQEGGSLLSRAPHIDLVFGPSDIGRLPEIIEQHELQDRPVVDIDGDPSYHLKRVPAVRTDRIKAWVSIMYGCDNFCTYCVVPYLRGRERSRPADEIAVEVQELASAGVREVTLLGQNVNSYGKGLESAVEFPELLRRLNDETAIERIRFVTSHPKDLSERLVRAVADLPKVCESIHLPVQSGSDRVLGAMNRRYTRDVYRAKVHMLREAVPSIALTTDIIAGFPGETEKDLDDTLRLLDEMRFDGIFAFKYSERPNTAARSLPGHLPEAVKDSRLDRILALQKGISQELRRARIGSIEEVLIDGPSKRGSMVAGRTRGNSVVNVPGPATLVGSTVKVRIASAGSNSLRGEICG